MLFRTCLLAILLAVQAEEYYRGHKVYKIDTENEREYRFVYDIVQSSPEMDFWLEHIDQMRVRVSPEAENELLEKLDAENIFYSLRIPDVQTVIDEQKRANDDARQKVISANRQYDWTYYMPFSQMDDWLWGRYDDCGNRCEFFSIGWSYEGYPLYVMKITGAGDDDLKENIWIDAGIHAREWIAHSTATWLIDHFIDDYPENSDVREILENYNIYIMPCMNPDGYVYSHDEERLWRKTRSPNDGSECVGTDANRNFDHEWNTVGTDQDPCSNNYPGAHPFSEVEALHVSQFLTDTDVTDEWKLYFTMHSSGQLYMTPWGYTFERPNEPEQAGYDELYRVAELASDAIHTVHGTLYTPGQASHILYESSGTSRDWAYGALRAEYVYTIELPDTGEYGHLLPPEYIIPVGEETMQGVITMIMYMVDNSQK